jgi:uncharacterized phiE125 gp8 family phage protein
MNAAAIPAAALAGAVAAAREQMRVPEGAEASLLARVAASAMLLGEGYTGCLFVRRAVEEVLPVGGWQALDALPVAAIAAVRDEGGVALAADAYSVDIDGEGRGWVRVTAPLSRVRVSATAGLAETWDALPAPLAQGVAVLAAHLFERGPTQPPAAVGALWRPWRRMRLGFGSRPEARA